MAKEYTFRKCTSHTVNEYSLRASIKEYSFWKSTSHISIRSTVSERVHMADRSAV